MVCINGNQEDAAGMVLLDYLKQNHVPPEGVAVECNEEIIRKNRYSEYIFQDGDTVEIVSFVGGG